MRVGLESDIATKCDGNRIHDVSYGTAAVCSEAYGHLYEKYEKRERERAEIRVDFQ